MGGVVTEGPQEYPHYVPEYYVVFFTTRTASSSSWCTFPADGGGAKPHVGRDETPHPSDATGGPQDPLRAWILL